MLTPPSTGKVQSFNPRGQRFRQRLDAFIADVRTTYGLFVGQDAGRTAEWQQRLHICHMFLYNKYLSTMPRRRIPASALSPGRTSDPKVVWVWISFTDILRTKTRTIPVRGGNGWQKNCEPDRASTETHAKELLVAAGIGNSGKAMVSSGLSPCGEPCRCGAGRSKHLDGVAADLNTTDMAALVHRLMAANAGSIDDYLQKFGLHRPLLNHPESPEPWHIEATTP